MADDPAQARGVPARVRRFDPEVVAAFTEEDVERLLGRRLDRASPRQDRSDDHECARDPGAALGTPTAARAALAPRARRPPAPRSHADWLSSTSESEELAKVLRRAGFRFIGPTTVHAAMQACGVVNAIWRIGVVREDVEAEGFVRPLVSVLTIG